MTDARLPGRWLNSPTLDQLTDRAWRVHTHALMWSAEQGTDGLIPRRTLRLLHPDGASDDDVSELVAVDLWAREGDDLRVVEWSKTQSPAEVVERQRERNRLNQQASRERARARAVVSDDVSGDVSDHVGGKAEAEARPRTATTRTTALERSASTRGSRLPADFTLDEQLLTYTLEHAPSINAARELEAFRDYWTSQPGSKGVKSDWRATWRMWVRRGYERALADGWKPSQRGGVSQLDAWLAARGVSREDYERRKGETGWLESLREVR